MRNCIRNATLLFANDSNRSRASTIRWLTPAQSQADQHISSTHLRLVAQHGQLLRHVAIENQTHHHQQQATAASSDVRKNGDSEDDKDDNNDDEIGCTILPSADPVQLVASNAIGVSDTSSLLDVRENLDANSLETLSTNLNGTRR